MSVSCSQAPGNTTRFKGGLAFPATAKGQRWLRLSLHLDRAEELGGMWDMGSVERSIEMRWHLQARPKGWKSFGGKSIADESGPGPITYQRMTFEIVQHLSSKSWTRVRIEISTAPIDRHRGPSWICVPDQLSLCSHHASEVCEEAQREHFKGFAGLAWRVTPTPKEKRVSSTTPTPPKRKQTSEKRKTEEGKTEGDSSSQKKRKKTKEGPYTCSLAAGTWLIYINFFLLSWICTTNLCWCIHQQNLID